MYAEGVSSLTRMHHSYKALLGNPFESRELLYDISRYVENSSRDETWMEREHSWEEFTPQVKKKILKEFAERKQRTIEEIQRTARFIDSFASKKESLYFTMEGEVLPTKVPEEVKTLLEQTQNK